MKQETIQAIQELLESGFPTPRTEDWLIEHLKKEVVKAKKARSRFQEYFSKNKEKLYDYHRQYRLEHPEYEAKRRERARIKSKTS